MLSDEEKKAIEWLKKADWFSARLYSPFILNLIEKQQKEIEELKETLKCTQNSWYEDTKIIEKQQKEIEELKEDRKKYAEEYIHNNPWLYKQLDENYILRVESEQKERKAWVKGTNDADELCNKKWEDKIKAKIEEYNETLYYAETEEGMAELKDYEYDEAKYGKIVLQSLLEKEE